MRVKSVDSRVTLAKIGVNFKSLGVTPIEGELKIKIKGTTRNDECTAFIVAPKYVISFVFLM